MQHKKWFVKSLTALSFYYKNNLSYGPYLYVRSNASRVSGNFSQCQHHICSTRATSADQRSRSSKRSRMFLHNIELISWIELLAVDCWRNYSILKSQKCGNGVEGSGSRVTMTEH